MPIRCSVRSPFLSQVGLLDHPGKLCDQGGNVFRWTGDGEVNGVASARARYIIHLEAEIEHVAVQDRGDLGGHNRSTAVTDQ
jgi:hypothetical protein